MGKVGFYSGGEGTVFSNTTLKTKDASSANSPTRAGSPNAPRKTRLPVYQNPILGDKGAGHVGSGGALERRELNNIFNRLIQEYKRDAEYFKELDGDKALANVMKRLQKYVTQFIDPTGAGYDTIINMLGQKCVDLIRDGNSAVPSYPKQLNPVQKDRTITVGSDYLQHYDGNVQLVEAFNINDVADPNGYLIEIARKGNVSMGFLGATAYIPLDKMKPNQFVESAFKWTFKGVGRFEAQIATSQDPFSYVEVKVNGAIVNVIKNKPNFAQVSIDIPKAGNYILSFKVVRGHVDLDVHGSIHIQNLKVYEALDATGGEVPPQYTQGNFENRLAWYNFPEDSVIKATFKPDVEYGATTPPPEMVYAEGVDVIQNNPPVTAPVNKIAHTFSKNNSLDGTMRFKYKLTKTNKTISPKYGFAKMYEFNHGEHDFKCTRGNGDYTYDLIHESKYFTYYHNSGAPYTYKDFQNDGAVMRFKIDPNNDDRPWELQFAGRFKMSPIPWTVFGYNRQGLDEEWMFGTEGYKYLGVTPKPYEWDTLYGDSCARAILDPSYDRLTLWRIRNTDEHYLPLLPIYSSKTNPSLSNTDSIVFADVGDVTTNKVVLSLKDSAGETWIIDKDNPQYLKFDWNISPISDDITECLNDFELFKEGFSIKFFRGSTLLKEYDGSIFSSEHIELLIPLGADKMEMYSNVELDGKHIYDSQYAYDYRYNDYYDAKWLLEKITVYEPSPEEEWRLRQLDETNNLIVNDDGNIIFYMDSSQKLCAGITRDKDGTTLTENTSEDEVILKRGWAYALDDDMFIEDQFSELRGFTETGKLSFKQFDPAEYIEETQLNGKDYYSLTRGVDCSFLATFGNTTINRTVDGIDAIKNLKKLPLVVKVVDYYGNPYWSSADHYPAGYTGDISLTTLQGLLQTEDHAGLILTVEVN